MAEPTAKAMSLADQLFTSGPPTAPPAETRDQLAQLPTSTEPSIKMPPSAGEAGESTPTAHPARRALQRYPSELEGLSLPEMND
jgi:hypothetical protein